MTSILDGAMERGPFAADGGRTGAAFERAILRDGRHVVVKHVSSGDLLPSLTGETDRSYRLWRSGVFQRVPPPIDPAILTVEPDGDGYAIVMPDESAVFVGNDYVLSREENRRLLGAIHAMHNTFWNETFDGATSEDERMSAFARLGDPSIGWYLAPVWQRGWQLFADLAPSDVAEAILKLREDPDLLTRELAASPKTFIHGDLRLHNIGLDASRIVLFDWEVAGTGTPATEISWYLIISASRIAATREQVIEDYRTVAGDTFDERSWDIACLFALLALGWNKAIDIVESGDPALQAQERADLDWWVTRARSALETWSPV
jgi:hypothetical protein